MHIFYGEGENYADVTEAAVTYCFDGTRIFIAAGDTASHFFADPAPGYLKSVIVVRELDGTMECRLFGAQDPVRILPTDAEKRQIEQILDTVNAGRPNAIEQPPATLSTEAKIDFYHAQLRFTGGDIDHEWAEQSMAVDFLSPNARVLELGSNIGRNTLMISCILNDPGNLVTVECNPFFVDLLRNNRFANHFDFHIEAAALSRRRLMQRTDNRQFGSAAEAWEAIPAEELAPDHEWIPTVTFDELEAKYDIRFDTLVADCEGALYYILEDDPGLLANITTIILESDFRVAGQKWSVERRFAEYDFERVYSIAPTTELTDLPRECADSFWEVWKRNGS